MKIPKLLLISLIASLFYSCCLKDETEEKPLSSNSSADDLKVVVIDSCEYIQYYTYRYNAITHKGNCKYCAERISKCCCTIPIK